MTSLNPPQSFLAATRCGEEDRDGGVPGKTTSAASVAGRLARPGESNTTQVRKVIMFNLKKAAICSLSAAAVAGLTLGLAAPASADPVDPTDYRALVAVGSDTIQDVTNGLGEAVLVSSNPILASYDATQPGSSPARFYDNIQTRLGGVEFSRPNGSTDGLRALSASQNPASFTWRFTNNEPAQPATFTPRAIGGQVDIARVSSAPTLAGIGTESDLAYVPMGRDAVTHATHASNTVAPSNIPLGTSTGQDTDGDGRRDLTLRNIYALSPASANATFTLEAGNTPYTVGNTASGAQIVPFIPQAASGTAAFWLSQVGGTLGSHVASTFSGGLVQEHDGAVLAALPTRAIVPFSIAQWLAQSNSASLPTDVTDRRNGAELGSVNGVAPTTVNSSGEPVLNSAFPISRTVYFVASNTRLESTNPADAQLQRFLRGAAGLGDNSNTVQSTGTTPAAEWIGNHSATITEYGFGALPNTGALNNVGVISGYRPFTS